MHAKKRSIQLWEAMRSSNRFCRLIGQLPYRIVKNDNGSYSYHFKRSDPATIVYSIINTIFTILVLFLTVGFVCLIFEVRQTTYFIRTKSNSGFEEDVRWDEAIFSNNWVILFIFYCWMFQTLIGIVILYYNGEGYVHYINYWNRAVQVMDMETTAGIRRFITNEFVIFGVITVFFVFVFIFVGTVRASCGLIAVLIFRIPFPDLVEKSWFVLAEIFGFILVIYGYLGSQAVLLQLVIFSRMLKNGVKVWTTRLKTVIDRDSGVEVHKDAKVDRTRNDYNMMIKDYSILVHLFQLTESVFDILLKCFYLIQILCLISELLNLYFLLGPLQVTTETFINRSWAVAYPDFVNLSETNGPTVERTLELDEFGLSNKELRNQVIVQAVLLLVLFIQSVVACVTLTLTANDASEEALIGFALVRRRGLMYCSKKSERNFMHNMITAFGFINSAQMSAGGYFGINKPLVIGVLGSVCAYLIIMIQVNYTIYEISPEDYRLYWGEARNSVPVSTTTTSTTTTSTTIASIII